MSSFPARWKTTGLSLLVYLGIWKGLTWVVRREILLPAPETVLAGVFRLLREGALFPQVGATLLRGGGGFSLSLALGLLCGAAMGRSPRVHRFLSPLIVTIRSVPVLSLILLAIIWFQTDLVPVFICFLVAFPLITGSVAAGVRQIDPELLEMARIYRKTPREIFWGVSLPSLLPYVSSGISSGLGLTWKSVVAAEILSMPSRGMGTAMQDAQLQLDTPLLFSWTLLVLLLAGAFDLLFLLAERALKPQSKGALP